MCPIFSGPQFAGLFSHLQMSGFFPMQKRMLSDAYLLTNFVGETPTAASRTRLWLVSG